MYGSRVKWTSRPQSDLDLVVFATPEQRRQVGDLREAFEESNLPFQVDLFVWDDVPESFRKLIEAEHVPLARPTRPSCPDGWVQTRLGDVMVLKRGYGLPERDRRHGPVPVVSSSGITDARSSCRCSACRTPRSSAGGMTEALLALPTHLRKRLAQALDSGMLAPPYAPAAVNAAVGGAPDGEAVAWALGELHDLAVSGRGCAAWLRGFEQVASRRTGPDFVWSGPEVAGLHARDTRRVYEELLGSAARSAWVRTYAFFDGPRAFEVLARRMDETPGLSVSLLLNVQRK